MPNHLCVDVGLQSGLAWLTRTQITGSDDTVREWWQRRIAAQSGGSVPVGSDVIEWELWGDELLETKYDKPYRDAIKAVAPLPGTEIASLITSLHVDGYSIDMFFLVQHHVREIPAARSAEDFIAALYPTTVMHKIVGEGSLDRVNIACKTASTWWTTTLAGVPVGSRRGRKPGLEWPLQRIEALKREYKANHGSDWIPEEVFTGWLDETRSRPGGSPSSSTLQNRLAEHQVSWRDWWAEE